MIILGIDVGGTHIKLQTSADPATHRFDSGPEMSARRAMARVRRIASDWRWDVAAIGYPGLVVHGRIATDPQNLGPGWVGFDFAQALGTPVRLANDAAIQALGSYRGGRLLFLGLGTGLGAAMIVDGVVQSMELAHLPYRGAKSYEHYVGAAGRRRLGNSRWRHHVWRVVRKLRTALEPDDIVIGGGNVRHLDRLPSGVRRGDNANAFAGAFLLWQGEIGESPRPVPLAIDSPR